MKCHATYPDAGAFAEALCAFINHELPQLHSRVTTQMSVTPETPLFETGLLDSLAILHVVAFVEDAIGRPLAIDEVVMGRFRDARTIAASFWSPPGHGTDRARTPKNASPCQR